MTLSQDYSKFVASVWKPGSDIQLDDRKRELLHVALLLTGESTELLDADGVENAAEELGDLLFGLHALRNLVPGVFWLSEIHWGYGNSTPVEIAIVCGEIADRIKKHAIYGQELDCSGLTVCCQQLHNLIVAYCDYLGTTAEDLIAANQAKLSKRYPSGYSDEAAKARADKQ